MLFNDKTISELNESNGSNKKYKIEFSEAIDESVLNSLEAIVSANKESNYTYMIDTNTSKDIRSEIFKLASDENLPLLGLQEISNSLEDIFHALTKDS